MRTKLTSKLMFTDILRRKNFLMTKKIKKTECPFKRFWYSTKNTMGNSVKARFTRLPSAIFFLKFFYVFFSNSCIWKMPYFRNLFITKISFFCFEKTKCVNEHWWIFEIAVRNFLLAEQQAHEQVKKVQIKPSFILKLLTCVSGHSLFFRKCG